MLAGSLVVLMVEHSDQLLVVRLVVKKVVCWVETKVVHLAFLMVASLEH